MNRRPKSLSDGVAVPSGRLARLVRMGGMAGGIAGSMVAGGLSRLATGRRPRAAELMLTPANAQRVAQELARMRGAAMKVGQLLSMDAGDVLPPEIATILDRLREEAEPMPPKQLRRVLEAEWGADWIRRFARFDVRPIAAASIGQVHRARTRDGRDLAIKIQYPGIRDAIDSDVNNVWGLMRYSGAVPRGLDLAPLMEDAKRQLHEEADYRREAEALRRFGALLADDPDFKVPRVHEEFCTGNVLAMEYMESRPLTDLAGADQAMRDRMAGVLIELVLRELFVFGAMQTDPNFANYRFEPDTGQIVLLDFGAARWFDPELPRALHRLMVAGLERDEAAARAAMAEAALLPAEAPARHWEVVSRMFDLGMETLRMDAPFDFGESDLVHRLRDMGLEIGTEREFWHVPATDTLLVQRKVAGTYLMAARLRARVRLDEIVARYR